ncbi:MAG: nuclear transport factor 2 family protein [Bacteroidota bacterium]
MTTEQLIKQWFEAWEKGDLDNLPISDSFRHTSPFGTIDCKKAYLDLVEKNRSKFLGQSFEIHDALFESHKACVRYTARQGEDFSLDVSEWYLVSDNLIQEIVAYYHIGEIVDSRKLDF